MLAFMEDLGEKRAGQLHALRIPYEEATRSRLIRTHG
jgi:hypothetical protein